MNRPILFVLALGLLLVASQPAHAGIISGTNLNTTFLNSPPASLLEGNPATTDNSNIFAINEQQGVTLATGLTVNRLISGGEVIGAGGSPPGPTTALAAGTFLNSHILHHDRTFTGGVTATVLFDTPIIALSFNDATLNGSDFLGNSGTTYPTGTTGRRMIFGEGTDSISVSADRLQLTALTQFVGGPFLDELRVFTEATAIPEPSTFALAVLGLLGLVGWHRRKRA